MILLLVLVGICVTGSALVPVLARWAQATMQPSRAVIVTTGASLSAALGLGISLCAVAIASLAGWGPIAREGDISTALLRSLVAVPAWLGVSATVLVAGLLAHATVRALVATAAFCRSARLCRALPGRDRVVFVDGDDIVTLAGLHGRIVVGTTLFDRLDPLDQRVVLTHEHSHLRRRHHLYVQAVDLAAAANPLLGAVPDIVRLGVERWADEDAAGSHGVADRDLAARALARVALQRNKIRAADSAPRGFGASPANVLAVAALRVSTRVNALLEPARPSRTGRMLAVAAVSAVVLGAGVFGLAHVNDLIEAAQYSPPHA